MARRIQMRSSRHRKRAEAEVANQQAAAAKTKIATPEGASSEKGMPGGGHTHAKTAGTGSDINGGGSSSVVGMVNARNLDVAGNRGTRSGSSGSKGPKSAGDHEERSNDIESNSSELSTGGAKNTSDQGNVVEQAQKQRARPAQAAGPLLSTAAVDDMLTIGAGVGEPGRNDAAKVSTVSAVSTVPGPSAFTESHTRALKRAAYRRADTAAAPTATPGGLIGRRPLRGPGSKYVASGNQSRDPRSPTTQYTGHRHSRATAPEDRRRWSAFSETLARR